MKKNEVVEIVHAKKNTRTRAEKKTRLFFKKWVSIYFEFCMDKFSENPSFDGSAPRDLGMIYDAVEKKCIEKGLAWSEELSERSWRIFLEFAWKDNWLQQNFLLFNLNRQKDKIFFQIKSSGNGKQQSSDTKEKFSGSHKTMGQHVFADRLKGKLDNLTGQ